MTFTEKQFIHKVNHQRKGGKRSSCILLISDLWAGALFCVPCVGYMLCMKSFLFQSWWSPWEKNIEICYSKSSWSVLQKTAQAKRVDTKYKWWMNEYFPRRVNWQLNYFSKIREISTGWLNLIDHPYLYTMINSSSYNKNCSFLELFLWTIHWVNCITCFISLNSFINSTS